MGAHVAGNSHKPKNAVKSSVIYNEVREKLVALEKSTLRVLAIAAVILFTTRIVASFLFIPFGEALTVSGALSISVLLALVILFGLFTDTLKNTLIRPATMLLVSLITFNVFYILHTTGNYFQFFFATLLLVVFGLAAPTFATWLVFVVPFLGAFVVSLVVVDIANLTPYIAALIGGLAISTIAYFVRMPTIRKLTELEVVQSFNAEKLEQSNQAKDQFLANMTHELRTPLTGVIGMVDLMADTELTDLQRHYLNTTRKSTRYLLTVINDILDMSKLEAGKLIINEQPIDVIELCTDIASLFDMRTQQKGLELLLELPQEKFFTVLVDGMRISQVLLNLLENALKFTNKGTITIVLEISGDSDATELTWRVRDTGTGIPKDRLPKLFDRFEQVDSSSTRTTPGTGLGLAIVHDLISLMGGEVGATSELGKGSEFWFKIRAKNCIADAEPVDPKSIMGRRFMPVHPSEYDSFDEVEEAEKPAVEDEGHSLRILFAEDNQINLELIRRILRREGWRGTAARNGKEAIDAVQSDPNGYDIILMDIQMPVLDGLSALKILKAEVASPLPVVALTANTLPEDMALYLEAGFDAVVGKPIDVNELRTVVEELTKASRP